MRFVWTLSSYHTCCLRYTQGCADWLNRCHKWRRPRSQMDIRAYDSLSWGEKQENEHLAESKAALYMNIMFMIDAVSAIMIGAQIAKDFFSDFIPVRSKWVKDIFDYVKRIHRCFVTGFTARTKQFLWPHTCVHLNMGTCFPIHLTSFHYTENNDNDSEVKRLL